MYFSNQERSYFPVFLILLDATTWQKTFGVKRYSNLLQYLNMILEMCRQKIIQKDYKINTRQKKKGEYVV